jgi:hypothetical protein
MRTQVERSFLYGISEKIALESRWVVFKNHDFRLSAANFCQCHEIILADIF